MPEKLQQLIAVFREHLPTVKGMIVDQIQVNAPWSSSFAVVSLADLKDIVAIVTMVGGLLCSIYVAYHKTKKDKQP